MSDTVKTPEQAAFEAFQASRARRLPMMHVTAWTHPAANAARDDWRAASQAAIAAALPELAALRELVRDMLQALPDTADEQEWRDRAGSLGVTDPDGQPYRAWTEEDL